MRTNVLKAKLKKGEPCFGVFIGFPSPTVVEICGLAGLDFVIIDSEHGPMNPQSCEDMVRAADVTGITPIIRVAQNLPQVILRYLDVGALGVQMPMINTRADAELAVRSVKYFPLGRRGLANPRAASYGLREPLSEYVKIANQETMLITHVETVESVHNLAEVLEIPEIDTVFIGPADLSHSFGYPGRPEEPIVQETIDKVIKQVLASGKSVGTIARDGEHAKQLIDKGVTYLANGASGLLASAVRRYHTSGRAR